MLVAARQWRPPDSSRWLQIIEPRPIRRFGSLKTALAGDLHSLTASGRDTKNLTSATTVRAEIDGLPIAGPTGHDVVKGVRGHRSRLAALAADHKYGSVPGRTGIEGNPMPIGRPMGCSCNRTFEKRQLLQMRAIGGSGPDFEGSGAVRAEHDTAAIGGILAARVLAWRYGQHFGFRKRSGRCRPRNLPEIHVLP